MWSSKMNVNPEERPMSVEQEAVLLCLCGLLFIALLYSFFALSLAMFGFGLLALFEVNVKPWRFKWRGTFPSALARFVDQPTWWVMTIPFFLIFFGAFHSDDSAYWLTRMRIKVPFLLFPMAFFLLPVISAKVYQRIHLLFIIVMVVSALPIVRIMLLEYDQILLRLQQGQTIDAPGSHIRYSLLIALASLSAILLWYKDFYPKSSWQAKSILLVGISLVVFLHFLAVRSGIMALYFTGFVLWIKLSLSHGFTRRSLILLAGFVAIPATAYFTVPSFKNKVHYMVEDLSKYQSKNWNAYSDSERLLSIRAGIEIAKSHWLVGVGPGDLKEEVRKYFWTHFDKDSFILPHNQFVTVAAGSGLLGLLAFLLFLVVPLLSGANFRNDYLLTIYVIIGLSLMVENTFETSVGVAIFIFFAMLGLNHQKSSAGTS